MNAFSRVFVLLVLMTVLMCVLLSMLYYIQILKRAQEIERKCCIFAHTVTFTLKGNSDWNVSEEREDMKLGKILPSKV